MGYGRNLRRRTAQQLLLDRGGGAPTPTPTPALTPSYSYHLQASNPVTYPGSVFPANGASLSTTLTDVVTGAVANKTSTAAGAFVSNAANGKGGIKLTNATAYTILNANLPPNFFNQSPRTAFTLHLAYTGLAATGNSGTALCWAGAAAQLFVDARATVTTANGVGTQITGAGTIRTNVGQDAGVHVLTIVSDNVKIPGQVGNGGRLLVYVDGVCVGSSAGYADTAVTDFILGALTQAGGTSSANLTILDVVFYPTAHKPIDVWRDFKYFCFEYGKTAPTKMAIIHGSSLFQGVNGTQAFSITGSLISMLGLSNAPCVSNLAIGSTDWDALDDIAVTEVDPFFAELGPENVGVFCGEGYNELISNTAAVSVAHGVTYLRNRIAAGALAQRLWPHTITGVSTLRSGYAKYKDYADLFKAIPATESDLALVNIIPIDEDPHMGVAADTATNGGYYGNTALGSNGGGANSDGFNGRIGASSAGGQGDSVHFSAISGFIDGVTGTISGYPWWAYYWLKDRVAGFLA